MVLASAAIAGGEGWELTVPKEARAFKFGNSDLNGFVLVTPETRFDEQAAQGFVNIASLRGGGGQLPDPLTGTYVADQSDKPCEFRAKVPNGDYLVWLCSGKIVKPGRFLLKVNEQTLFDQTPTLEQFEGEDYRYRCLREQALRQLERAWEYRVGRSHPVYLLETKVTNGVLSVVAANHFLAALIVMPKQEQAAFAKLTATIREQRIQAFSKQFRPGPAAAKIEKQPDDGDCLFYVPQSPAGVGPAATPNDQERKTVKVEAAGAPGERVLIYLALTPFADLGQSELVLPELKGPGVIPAANFRCYFRHELSDGTSRLGTVLLPTTTRIVEKGVAEGIWLWLLVPDEAPAGLYKGEVVLKSENGAGAKMPLEFEVYPFKLAAPLPAAFGFWQGIGPVPNSLPAEAKRQLLKDRLELMRELGFTSFTVEGASIAGLNADGTVKMNFDSTLFDLAREAGLGRHPLQMLMNANLMSSFGRPIGKRLLGMSDLDEHPGAELRNPGFKKLFLDAARQYAEFVKKTGMPFVATAVDEPRETEINPWNRNLEDTIAYCEMMRAGGLMVCVDPMADANGIANKDYTPLLDYVDVLSTHSWEGSRKLMRLTPARHKILWIYNVGMDRYSWGFYNWRVGSAGRWEWGNPFLAGSGWIQEAPYTTCKGGLLFAPGMFGLTEGIRDYAYAHTLDDALLTDYTGKAAAAAAAARDFRDALLRAMPEFPHVKGLASPADGPKVGMGIADDAQRHVNDWRRQIADHLKQMGYTGPRPPRPDSPRALIAKRRGQAVEACLRAAHAWQIDMSAQSGQGDPQAFGRQNLAPEDLARVNAAFDKLLAAGTNAIRQWVDGDPAAPAPVEKSVTDILAVKMELADNLPVSAVTKFIQYRLGDIEPARIRSVANLYQVVLEVERDAPVLQELFGVYLALGLPVYLDELAIYYDRDDFIKMGQELAAAGCPAPYNTSAHAWHLASRKIKNWGEQKTGKVTAATYVRELLAMPEISQSAAAIKALPPQKICVLGHSFTMSEHWSSQASFADIAGELLHGLNPNIEYKRFSRGGLGATLEYSDQIAKFKPDATFLAVGVWNEEHRKVFAQLVADLRKNGSKVYVFDTLTPTGVSEAFYNAADVAAARAAGATILEVGKILDTHLLKNEFVALDGVHMSPTYHKVMAAEMVRFLAGARPATLPAGVAAPSQPVVATVKSNVIQRLEQLPALKDWQWEAAVKGLTEIDFGEIGVGGGQKWIAARVFAGNAPEGLYLLWVCCEPNTEKLAVKFKNPQTDHDKYIWEDDSAEMFFATDPAKAGAYYQLIVNPAGSSYDGIGRNSGWNAKARIQAQIVPSGFGRPGAWLAEIIIPWESLGGRPEAGATWKINLTRSRRQLNVPDWEFTFAPMPNHNFHQPERFKPVLFQ
jgi:hypothetical protein